MGDTAPAPLSPVDAEVAPPPSGRGATNGPLDDEAALRLMAECYNELRAMAYHALRFRAGDTLQPTSVVHEVFLKLRRGGVLSEAGTASLATLAEAGAAGVVTEDQREHFLALASRAMRQVLGDAARRRTRLKRSAPGTRISIADLALGTSPHTRASMPELRQDSSRGGHAVDVELLTPRAHGAATGGSTRGRAGGVALLRRHARGPRGGPPRRQPLHRRGGLAVRTRLARNLGAATHTRPRRDERCTAIHSSLRPA